MCKPRAASARGVLCWLITCATPLAGQARSAAPTVAANSAGTVVAQYTVADGLPVNAITNLKLGRSGYLWITTFDGLVRWDGVRFTTYSIANTPGLPTNRLLTVHESRDGALWVITEQFELVQIVRRQARPIAVGTPVRGLSEAPDGTIWLRTAQGVGVVRAGRFEPVAPKLITQQAEAIAHRRDGSTWVAYGAGRLVRVKAARAERLPDARALRGGYVRAMHEDPAGQFWIVGERGLVRWDETPTLVVAEPQRVFLGYWGPSVFADSRDQRTTWVALRTGVWRVGPGASRLEMAWRSSNPLYFPLLVATRDSGVLVVHGGDAFRLARTTGDEAPRVTRLPLTQSDPVVGLEDREGTLWIGTTAKGLLQLKATPVQMALRAATQRSPLTYAVSAIGNAVWYGTSTGDLVRVDPFTGAAQAFSDRLPPTSAGYPSWWVRSIVQDRTGRLWVAGNASLLRCDAPGTASMRCRRLNGEDGAPRLRDDESALALHLARDGRLWMGSDAGLYVYDGLRWRREDGASVPKAPRSAVRAFAETPDGALWMGTLSDGLVRYAEGRFRAVRTTDGLPANLVRSLHVDDRGMLWVGTEGRGLAHLDPREWSPERRGRITTIDSRHGLFDDVLHMMLADDAGRLWFNTNRGLFHVATRELRDFVAGRTARVNAVAYTERDGMANREGNGGSQPAGARTADGRLWFPTQQGVAIVDPSRVLRVPVPPTVVVEAVRAGDTTVTAGDTPIAPGRGRRDLEVDYTAPSFVAPRSLRFRYRLDPYDTAWVEAGARRTAFYTRVPPGRYTFRVLAGTDDGRWSPEPGTVQLDITPRWWETSIARLVALLGLALAAFGAVQWRLRLVRRRADLLEEVVTERTGALRERESQLAQRNTQLADLVESRARLFANLSHEFRTPLTLILGPLRSLLDGRHGTLTHTLREQGELMERNGQRLLRLINQVLDLSRLQANAVALRREPRDLGVFVREIALAFTPLAERRRIALAVHAPPEPVIVSFDAEQLEKVLLNLLSNAFKFTDPGGRVVVRVMVTESHAVVAVQDTGIGIAPEQLPHVFDRFWQADASATRRHEGTGIGLALAKELVALHEGTLQLASTVGEGSTFTVSLARLSGAEALAAARRLPVNDARATTPVPVDDEPPARARGTAEPVGPTADDDEASLPDAVDRTTVLLVDDNADVRAFVRSLLRQRYRVLEAADGAEGLAVAREALPDCIVADVMMPELDGLGLGRALRADPMTDAIPLVLLTARADTADLVAGLETGADAYLTKPFDAEVLEATIASLLRQRRRLRERYRSGAIMGSESLIPSHESSGDTDPLIGAGPVAAPKAPSPFEQRLRALVESRLTESGLDHNLLADLAGLSYHQLYRGLKEATGESPSRFIRRVRVERAAELLRARAGNVSEVAYSVGFESLSYFSRAFTERFNVAPSALLRGELTGPASDRR